jgi:hypothetical protein
MAAPPQTVILPAAAMGLTMDENTVDTIEFASIKKK